MKSKFNKYCYLGVTYPEVPKPLEPILLDMLHQIDKIIRPYWTPRWLLNIQFRYNKKPIPVIIKKIKYSFGQLKITGTFPSEIQEIVTKTEVICNNTCEFCGNPNTSHVMIKSWVRNICATCKEVKKNGSNN